MSGRDDWRFLSMGRLKADHGWSMKAHSHAFHEMIIVLKGEQHVRMKDESVTACAGDVLLYRAGEAHEEWSAPYVRLETLFVAFEWPSIPEGTPLKTHDKMGRMRAAASWLHDERKTYYASAGDVRHGYTGALLGEFLRLAGEKRDEMVECSGPPCQEKSGGFL
ncbi:MAG TPA: cupin domain-containing protein [Planctomycetes bacterium]|nr:cupin domain-containing protein [Planctomycetota bacterium]